jgi:long-chain acyl-CoA synthetase
MAGLASSAMIDRSTFKGFVSGARHVSRAELDTNVARLASGLAALGIGAGDSVAILLRNEITFLEASYGAMRVGAYAVPINWHNKIDEVAYILEDCGARVLIVHADLLGPIATAIPPGTKILCVPTPPEIQAGFGVSDAATRIPAGVTDYESWRDGHAPYDGPTVPAPQSMIYTSGTTGRPKGVRRAPPTAEEQAGITALRKLAYNIKPGIRALVPGPLYHSAPNSFGLRGGNVCDLLVTMPRFDAEEFLRLIATYKIDTVKMVPTMFSRLLKLPLDVRNRYDLSSLQFIVHAAAPCPPDVKAGMIAWLGPIVHEFYGSTEAGTITFATAEEWLKKPGTVGRATPGSEVRILDADGKRVPACVVGEVYSRVPAFQGFTYHNQTAKRAEIDRDGLVTSGDIGYLDEDGYLFLCDRKNDMIIFGGTNIYPAEIEAELHAIPGVQDCAVFGIPDADFGETVMAVVEPLPDATLDVDTVRETLKSKLASYKVPRHIEIRRGLPREDSGKIFKRRLRDPYWEKVGRKI